MLELYCDQLIDLLPQDQGQYEDDVSYTSNMSGLSNLQQDPSQKLQIRKTTSGDTYIKNLSWAATRDSETLINLLGQGMSRRHVAETALNDRSSRSHTIIYLKIKQY